MVLRAFVVAALLVAVAAHASAQDVLTVTPPEMQSLVPAADRPSGADTLRLGAQMDFEGEVALLPFSFAGTAAYRPPELTVAAGDFVLRPLFALRLRAPGTGTEAEVGDRLITSGSEVALETALELSFAPDPSFSVSVAPFAWAGVHQAGVPREGTMERENDLRLATAGIAAGGARVGVVGGPVYVGGDLTWHTVTFGAGNYPGFVENVEDGPEIGVQLVLRMSSHLYAHFRAIPELEPPLVEKNGWTVGIAGSFDPFLDTGDSSGSGGARAEGAASSGIETEDEPSPRERGWPYPTFHALEYALTFGLPVAFQIIDHNTQNRGDPSWRGPILFDSAVTSALGERSDSMRETSNLISDIGWYGTMFFPLADTLITTLIVDTNPYVAWQMTAINLQSMAVNAFLTLTSIRAFGRSRPDYEQCEDEGNCAERGVEIDARSFPSGHTAGAFNGAGLACAHHIHMDLYQSEAADTAACIGALTVASSVGVFRLIADRHWATDILSGAVIGLGAGWLLPWLLHYRHGPDDGEEGVVHAPPVSWSPVTDGQTTFGLAASGLFF